MAQAADYLGVSVLTIRRYVSSGRLTGYRAGQRLIRIKTADVDSLLQPIPNALDG